MTAATPKTEPLISKRFGLFVLLRNSNKEFIKNTVILREILVIY